MRAFASSRRDVRTSGLVLVAALGLLALMVAHPVTASAGDYREDDCRSTRHIDEKGFVWWEHDGNRNNDTCYGTGYRDVFWGRGGDDLFFGGRGADEFHMGSGRDIAYGSSGPDRTYGGDDHDVHFGGKGKDRMKDTNRVSMGDWDCLIGGPGTDRVNMFDNDPMDDYWAGPGWDPYPEKIDYGGGGISSKDRQDNVFQAEGGPCRYEDCSAPYGWEECTKFRE